MTHMPFSLPIRSNTCCIGQEPLEPNQEIVSVLIGSKDSYERFDYCVDCWEKEGKEKHHSQAYWRFIIPEKPAAPPKTRDEKALILLREVLVQEEKPARDLAWILSLYLERREQLIKRQEKKGTLFFEIVDTQEMFQIARQPLSPTEMIVIQQELKSKLS
ncbi:MAG: hypothetical protein JHC93_05025 [Parachlamydiales bacterium]|nr:hypothetical protein [Parachlamydiales bacterium]